MQGSQRAAHILVASNRGPVTYSLGEDGELTSKRGGGGLVSGLSPAPA
jgi:trehalose 6-phosphate synthase